MKNQATRRTFLRYMGVLGIITFYAAPANAKTTKLIVKYQEMPESGNSCKSCLHFIPATRECKIVEGFIDPESWCVNYNKNPQYKEE